MSTDKITWANDTRKLGDLKPWPSNPRKSRREDSTAILESFNEFGQVHPLVVSGDSELYDGHQRLASWVEKFGVDFVVDVRVSSRRLTDKERRLLVARLHATAKGQWDFEKLKLWGEDLTPMGFDKGLLKLWGDNVAGLGGLLKEAEKQTEANAEPQTDKAAELQEKWQTATGQLWAIGEHRLLCGDSTRREDVERVMGGEVAELNFTSPPYSDMRDYHGGDLSVSNIASFIPEWREFARYFAVNLGIQRKDGEVNQYWDDYIAAARECGLKLLSWNVWDKGRSTSVASQTAMFSIEHEFIFVFGESAKPLNRTVEKSDESDKRLKYAKKDKNGNLLRSVRQADGSFKNSNIGENFSHKNMPSVLQVFPQMARDITTEHSAPFPVTLPFAYVEAMTNAGDIVAEPFGGSGTTMVACQNSGRKCRAIEISPAYCAVILERMAQAFPGIDIHLVD